MTRTTTRLPNRNHLSIRGDVTSAPIVTGTGADREAHFPLTVSQAESTVHHTVIVRGEGVDFAEHVLTRGMPVIVEGRVLVKATSIVELYPGVRLPIVVIYATDIRTAYPERSLKQNR